MKPKNIAITLFAILVATVLLTGCPDVPSGPQPQSSSGAKRMVSPIKLDAQGHTIEQRLASMRLARDNQPGSFKYVYVINSYTGSVMSQSMAVGKVVSSGKRLSPSTVAAGWAASAQYTDSFYGSTVDIGGTDYMTGEVISDDGTYGSSNPYLYWFDPAGNYHQVYATAVYIHVSSAPLVIRNATLTMEIDNTKQSEPSYVAPEIQKLRQDFK